MSTIQEAIDALKPILQKKGVERQVQDVFNHLASCLVLLNSSSPSVQMIRKLCTVLREPFLPLYNACLQPALQLSCAVLSTVLDKVCNANEGGGLRAAWDATAEVVLSGILDYLDQTDDDNVESGVVVWEVLNRLLCEFFFYNSSRGQPAFSVPLCLSAYSTLTETAAMHVTVRDALRHEAFLGGGRLGVAISGARGNYLVLEALLMLFARLLPPIHDTSQGKSQRIKFVKEVFGSPKLFKCNAELLDIMQKAAEPHWDGVAAQIIDVLARGDITCPQPFSTDEIDVCGRVFPQPLVTDRLIVDRRAFLANVVAENDDPCESLQVPYSHIRTITLDTSENNVPNGKVLVMVYLTSPPLVANVEMKIPDGSHLYAKFFLLCGAVGRFMEALRRRGVGKLSFLNPPTRIQRTRKSVSVGSGFKFINDNSSIPPTASFEGKVQHVYQVYKTGIEDSTIFGAVRAPCTGDMDPPPTPDPKSTLMDKNLAAEVFECALAANGPGTLYGTTFTSVTNEASKPIQSFTFSLPENSTVFNDCDELSEISEFEPDGRVVKEQVATRISTFRNEEPKPRHHNVDRMPMGGSPSVTSTRTTDSASKTGNRTEETSQRSPEVEKPLLASNSPTFGSSSSTRINFSPKPLSNTGTLPTHICTEPFGGPSVASQDFVGMDLPKQIDVDECGHSRTESIITPAGQRPWLDSAEDKLREHTEPVVPSSGAGRQEYYGIQTMEDLSVPSEITGSRRKRETIVSLSRAIVDVDSESTPPRKRRRNDRLVIKEDKVKSDGALSGVISAPRAKRCTKMAGGSSRVTDPTAISLNESAELPPSSRGTRRSSRIKKKQTATTSGTRANAMRGRTWKGQRANDTNVETTRLGTTSTPSATPIQSQIGGSPHIPSVELRSTKNTTSETTVLRETLKAGGFLSCQPIVTPAKEPQKNLDLVRRVASFATGLAEQHFHTRAEDDPHVASDPRAMNNDINLIEEVVGRSVPLKESREPTELSRPIGDSTPPKTVTIDLTIDNSPVGEENKLHKHKEFFDRSEVDTQTRFTTPDRSGYIATEETAFFPSPRHRQRTVTFASPVEYVLGKKVKLMTQVSPPSRSSSPPKSNTLSPLRIPTESVSMKWKSPNRITLQKSKLMQAHNNAPAHIQIADEIEIKDIVEVLNEIQAVIIKGISDKFRNVTKEIQRSRDELVQKVLDELQGMVVENAKYFNGLLLLEEDYHKNSTAITRCWEELIESNDGIAAHVQKTLREHDQNISARTFPKSLKQSSLRCTNI